MSPGRMDRGANTGAPSPNCTLPWLWVAVSRITVSPGRMDRAFAMSLIECLLFAGKFLFPIVGDLKVLVPPANTTEIASWDRDCEVLRLVPVSGIIGSGHEAHDANRILRIRLFPSRLSHLCLIAGTSQGLERTDGRGCCFGRLSAVGGQPGIAIFTQRGRVRRYFAQYGWIDGCMLGR